MEITIFVGSVEPLTGRVVAAVGDDPDRTTTDVSFMGWLGLLRALDDVIGSSASSYGARSERPRR